MKKRGVIFDMDGLMFDTQSVYDECNRYVAEEEYGLPFPEAMRVRMMGRVGEDLCRVINSFFPDLDAAAFVERSHSLVAQKVKEELILQPGLEELLPYLEKEGYRLGLASGSSREIVEGNLERTGLRRYFLSCTYGDEEMPGKPDPACYLRAAGRIGCLPQDCYVLEDSPNGIRAGYRAGCSVLMVPNSVEPDEEIRSMCTGIYETLADVKTAMEAGII